MFSHLNCSKKIIISVLFALLAGLFSLSIYNMGLLLHMNDRGVSALGDGHSFELPSRMYVEKLVIDYEKPEGSLAEFSVTVKKGDGEVIEFSDRNPYALKREVINIRSADVSGIDIEAIGCTPTSSYIVNELSINCYVMFAGITAGLCLALLILFMPALSKRLELAFVIIALSMGGLMCVSLPREKIGYDEEEHLKALLDISAFPNGSSQLSDSIAQMTYVSMYSSSDISPGSREEQRDLNAYLAESGNYRDGSNVLEFDILKNRAPAYAVMAVTMKLCMLLGLSWDKVILMVRLSNLLMYTALMYIAIRKTPIGKALLLLIGLFPQNIFMASTFSYDPFVTGCLFAGMAYMLSYFNKAGGKAEAGGRDEVSGRGRDFALALIFIFLGCLPKAVYAPVALMLCAGAFSKKTECNDENESSEETKAAKRSLRPIELILPIAIFTALIASFILPTVFSPSEGGDVRGGATSEVSQVGYILSKPIAYAALLIREIFGNFIKFFMGPDCSTFMGTIVNGLSDFKGFYVLYMILLIYIVSSESGRLKLSFRLSAVQRLWIFLMIGACTVLIWTSMYVAFTEPLADHIAGVQGRYFIPLMFPFYLLFYNAFDRFLPKPLQLERGGMLWYYLVLTGTFLLLFLTIWVCVLKRFCF